MSWKKNNKRFVAFFDILGFKDMVLKHGHEDVLKMLEKLKKTTDRLESNIWTEALNKKLSTSFSEDQTNSITFSDSLILFSKGDTIEDCTKIMLDSYFVIKNALKDNILIKGALSFGKVTVDFNKSLFFGQPIIDAYLLHEDLHMLEVVLDHNAENQAGTFKKNEVIPKILHLRKVNMKFGMATHTLVHFKTDEAITERIVTLENLYKMTSGKPRLYIDNSMDYYKKFKRN